MIVNSVRIFLIHRVFPSATGVNAGGIGKRFEPGNFLVYVGTSSRDRDLKMTHFVMK